MLYWVHHATGRSHINLGSSPVTARYVILSTPGYRQKSHKSGFISSYCTLWTSVCTNPTNTGDESRFMWLLSVQTPQKLEMNPDLWGLCRQKSHKSGFISNFCGVCTDRSYINLDSSLVFVGFVLIFFLVSCGMFIVSLGTRHRTNQRNSHIGYKT
jgi:hypothetical protein